MKALGAWALLLWGPCLWLAHFLFVYGAASLELTLRPAAGTASRVVIVVATALALILVGLALRVVKGRAPGEAGSALSRFWIACTRLLSMISAVAIVWQALPALLVP